MCIDDRAQRSIKLAAVNVGATYIFNIPDLIAAEARYHKSFYDNFVKKKSLDENMETEKIPSVEEEAYKQVLKFCLELQYLSGILSMNDLYDMMRSKLAEQDLVFEQ